MTMKSMAFAAVAMIGAMAATAAAPPAPAPSLKDAYRGIFHVGVAMNMKQILGLDPHGRAIVRDEFDSISPENDLKWERIHPLPDTYDFGVPDRYVAFGEKNRMYVVGHVLVWHDQTPAWVFEDGHGHPQTRDGLLQRMREHIFAVVGRYKGRVNAWDVVNEALNEDGSMRQSPWYRIVGPDYIAKAFEYAHEADPQAELIYNDYNIESGKKLEGAVALIRKLKAEGVPVTTVGIQGHYRLDWPDASSLDKAIAAFAGLGVKVAITELDIDVLPQATATQTAEVTLSVAGNPALDPYAKGLPDAVQAQLTQRYADIFKVCLKHKDAVDRITVGGVGDKDSWKNDWPVKGRTNYPLLFDRAGNPKPAVAAIVEAAGK